MAAELSREGSKISEEFVDAVEKDLLQSFTTVATLCLLKQLADKNEDSRRQTKLLCKVLLKSLHQAWRRQMRTPGTAEKMGHVDIAILDNLTAEGVRRVSKRVNRVVFKGPRVEDGSTEEGMKDLLEELIKEDIDSEEAQV